MAKDLGAGKGANVVKLPTRAAGGAKKPKAASARLKPATPAAKGEKTGMGSTLKKTGDVFTDAALREALQSRLIGLRGQHRETDNKIEVLRGEIKELNSRRKEIRDAIKGTGMPLEIFDESYADAATSRVDLAKKEAFRDLIREAYGLPAGAQKDLLEKLPDAVKPAVYWEAEGYKDGIAGKFAKPPEECPPENGPDYMRGYGMATERNAKGLKSLKKDAAKAPGTPAPAPAKDDGVQAEDEALKSPETRDAPPLPPAPPINEGPVMVDGVNGGGKEGEGGDEFEEDSPEALAAQAGRRAAGEGDSDPLLH